MESPSNTMAVSNRRSCTGEIPQNVNWQKRGYPGKPSHLHCWSTGISNRGSSAHTFPCPFCSAIALPTAPTESKGKGEIWVKSNTFPDPDSIPISYSGCNAGDIIPVTNLQSFYSQSVQSSHVFPAWHFR